MSRIITHGNAFHPDELLAIALLGKTVYRDGLPEVVRTRELDVLKEAKADPETFVVDVGFDYEPALRNFDHHQGTLAESWADGTPYSSCGLVWCWLRQQGYLKDWGDDVLDAMEESLIKPADRFDNGVGGTWVEGELLAAYNRPTGSPQATSGFDHALRMASELIDNRFHLLQRDMKARAKVQRLLDEGAEDSHGVLVMGDNASTKYAYWAAALSGGRVNLLITPRSAGMWMLITAPMTHEDPFSMRTPAPESWRGRDHFEVEGKSGKIGIEFCHKNGFLTIVRGSAQAALEVAHQICENAHPELGNSRRSMSP